MKKLTVEPNVAHPTARTLIIEEVAVDLGKQAVITVLIADWHYNELATVHLDMTGNDFDTWGTDDQHVYDWLLTTLDFSEVVEPVSDGYDPDGYGI